MTDAISMVERTLVILKPDAIQRGLFGAITTRFENAGFTIAGAKMTQIDKEFAKKHYSDVAERRGEHVLNLLLDFITSQPVVALCIEGIDAVENVRKLVGSTEPKSSPPGTIRGDYAHVSFRYGFQKGIVIQNLVHASGTRDEADREVKLWFRADELYSYGTVYDGSEIK